LKHIHNDNDCIRIGAGITHAEVAKTPSIQREAKALAEGCAHVGSPQIQNIATLVGNVINAQPAADGAIPLIALETELKVVSKEGERWMPIKEAYRGPGASTIDSSREIVTELRFRKLGVWSETAFFRLARRKALTLPILNGAIVLVFRPSTNQIQRARIAMGPVAEKPFRAGKAETLLESEELSQKVLIEAARIASDEVNPRTSLRGSASYRKEMVRVNLLRVFDKIFEETMKRL
jgi:carbon-monoxide dehydrogenase medium subunit